ncbi:MULTISPECIES: hypothetical protein [Citrobacter]|uniref:hypothetical protein n=1 Tax=Citrobacter TaxID=544 RepID=UPI0011EF99DB|nr:hypothetical protein [Citrobacter braakii]
MRLGQLYRYLGELLDNGADEHLLVCIPGDGTLQPGEVDRLMLATGAVSEDASPAYAGFLQRDAQVVVLTSGPGHLERLTGSHVLTAPEPPAPAKSWPAGDWRRK